MDKLRKEAREALVQSPGTVSYTHLRAHETDSYLVCRLLLEKKKYAVFCLKKKNSFFFFFFLMIRRQPRSTHCISSAASDVYKRQPSFRTTRRVAGLNLARSTGSGTSGSATRSGSSSSTLTNFSSKTPPRPRRKRTKKSWRTLSTGSIGVTATMAVSRLAAFRSRPAVTTSALRAASSLRTRTLGSTIGTFARRRSLPRLASCRREAATSTNRTTRTGCSSSTRSK